MRNIVEGMRVTVRSADNRRLARRAVTGEVEGDDFPVIWVCREEEWEAAMAEDRPPIAIPWPVEDVHVAK
jgi:hypothetical protein